MTKERETWKSGLEFLFSCIAVCVGLGNIWRFPYVCYKNGGGAFLIPYFLFIFIIGMPQILLQFTYPQFSSLGPAKAWVCCPLFGGIGFAMIVTNIIASVYYNVIIAWTLYYFVNCFTTNLAWKNCNNYWNTETCKSRTQVQDVLIGNISTTIGNTSINDSLWSLGKSRTATEEFWQYNVLELSEDINSLGQVRWPLLLCNLAVCVIVFLCIFKGIKMSGKIMYVAASFPYISLTILLIRGLTLPGAMVGLKHYFVPRWGELRKLSVWFDAAAQVVFSVGFATGDNIVLASYNKFHHNLYRDAIIIPLIDAFTSLFAGCVIFITLGYMSTTFHLDITNIVTDGPGIAFMIFPEALATLPLSQLWSALFFITLFIVGVDSRTVHTQVLTGALGDLYPNIFRSKLKCMSATVCLMVFILGLPFVCQGGMYVLQLVDWYVASVVCILIVLMESSVLGWIYGATRLRDDIGLMVGFPIPKIWDLFWKYITPGCALFFWIFSMVKHRPVTYGDKSYPTWSIGVGWIIAIVPILPLPITMLFTLSKHKGTLLKRLRLSVVPALEWSKNATKSLQPPECQQNLC